MGQDNLEDLPGVGPATADKLHNSGFTEYQTLAVTNPAELEEKGGVGEKSAKKIVQAAREKVDIDGFITGTEKLKQENEIKNITTLTDNIDDILGGGIHTKHTTEFYGEFGSGKSQMANQLCVSVQLPEEYGGLSASPIFIDTEGSFQTKRVREIVDGLDTEIKEAMLKDFEIDGDVEDEQVQEELKKNVLENINVARAYHSNHQLLLTEKAQEIAEGKSDTDWPVGLVIVDSITVHFRSEYTGRGQLAERQQKLNKHIADLTRLGNAYNAAIVVANQVSANPDSFFGDPTQSIGGNIMGHSMDYRFYIKKSKEDKRIFRLVNAPDLPVGERPVEITDDGFVDT